MGILLVAEVIVLISLNKPRNEKYGVYTVFKYAILFGTTVGCSYVFINWRDANAILALLPMLAISLVTELFVYKFNKRLCYSIFSWTMVLFVLFNITNALYPNYSLAMARWILDLFLNVRVDWYVAVILLLLFLFGILATISLRKKGQSTASDTKLYLSLFGGVMFFWMMSAFYTRFHLIFSLIAAVAVILSLVAVSNDKTYRKFGFLLSQSNLYYSGVLFLVIGAPVAFYYGKILRFAVISFLALFLIFRYKTYQTGISQKKEADKELVEPHKQWSFWQVVLTAFAVYAAVIATEESRFLGNYILIAVVYLFATFVMWIINIPNTVSAKPHSLMRVVAIVPVLLIFLFKANPEAVQITYTVDNAISASEGLQADQVRESNALVVRVFSKKDNAPIKKAFCYWLQDKDHVTELKVGEQQSNVLEVKNDGLCIVCESESGVLFTKTCWFFEKSASETSNVGSVRENRSLTAAEAEDEITGGATLLWEE